MNRYRVVERLLWYTQCVFAHALYTARHIEEFPELRLVEAEYGWIRLTRTTPKRWKRNFRVRIEFCVECLTLPWVQAYRMTRRSVPA